VDDFVQCIQELAPKRPSPASRSIRRASYWSWRDLGLPPRHPPRVSSNKLNPFNIFQQEMKRDQNLELRTGRPAPGTAGINKGRPVFTGTYQKDLAEKYKPHQAEFQQNDAPPDKVEERLGPEGSSKVNQEGPRVFGRAVEPWSSPHHHDRSTFSSPRVQNCLVLFGRVWPGVCQVDGTRRVVDHALRNHVSRRRSIGGGPAEAGAT
jgi:hypothetical protein